jgi:DNA-binding NarL/FixJ family response regulator
MNEVSTADENYQQLVAEYRNSTNRCIASCDQLREAERELNALLPAGSERFRETHKIARQLFPLSSPADEPASIDLTSLSDREYEVFAMIGNGFSTRQIAEHLRVALSTVETYRDRLKSKLELGSGNSLTRQATIWALSQRLTKDY